MIVVVSGPGGAGKDTIVARLLETDPTLVLSRSWTTRPRRREETNESYTFVDRPAFDARVARDGFLEWAEYLGHRYGTPTPDAAGDTSGPEPQTGRDLLLVIEVQGARQVLERQPGTLMILIVPPSREVQEARLRSRGDADDDVARRLASAEEEERVGRQLAHHVVVNDDLDRAVAEVAGILADHRLRSEGV